MHSASCSSETDSHSKGDSGLPEQNLCLHGVRTQVVALNAVKIVSLRSYASEKRQTIEADRTVLVPLLLEILAVSFRSHASDSPLAEASKRRVSKKTNGKTSEVRTWLATGENFDMSFMEYWCKCAILT